MVFPRLLGRALCTLPNDGAVRVAKLRGFSVTVVGMPLLPPARPACMRW